jgi:hypothetical protein
MDTRRISRLTSAGALGGLLSGFLALAPGCVVRDTSPVNQGYGFGYGYRASAGYAAGPPSSVAVGPPTPYTVSSLPPEPLYEQMTPSPGYGYVWIDGYWHWNGYEWVWLGGRWVREQGSQYVYVQPHYGDASGAYLYTPGHWTVRGRVPRGWRIRDHRDGRPPVVAPPAPPPMPPAPAVRPPPPPLPPYAVPPRGPYLEPTRRAPGAAAPAGGPRIDAAGPWVPSGAVGGLSGAGATAPPPRATPRGPSPPPGGGAAAGGGWVPGRGAAGASGPPLVLDPSSPASIPGADSAPAWPPPPAPRLGGESARLPRHRGAVGRAAAAPDPIAADPALVPRGAPLPPAPRARVPATAVPSRRP